MTVSPQEREAMSRLLEIMNGNQPGGSAQPSHSTALTESDPVVLAGPGQVTSRDVAAMADVLRLLENAVNNTSTEMVSESQEDSFLKEALETTTTSDGVKIGIYKIQQQLDENRVAGRQYYNVINQVSGHVVATELSLYEAAHGLVRMLNHGLYFNSQSVRGLMEAEAAYTSHKIDAVRYHRMMKRSQREGNSSKAQLMETRKQSSMDKAMIAKSTVKKIYHSHGL